MMPRMTEMTNDNPDNLSDCPFCGSDRISGGEATGKYSPIEIEMNPERADKFWTQTGCLDCGALGPVQHDVDPNAMFEGSLKANDLWEKRA